MAPSRLPAKVRGSLVQLQPPAWDARTMSLPAIKVGTATNVSTDLAAQLAALETCARALRDLLLGGLSVPDLSAWIAYWHGEPRWERFVDLFKGFRQTLSGLPDEVKRHASEHAAHDLLVTGFPDKRGRLDQLRTTQDQLAVVLHTVLSQPLRSEELVAHDVRCAISFNCSQLWLVIALNSLLVAAEARQHDPTFVISDELVDGILGAADESSLDSFHAATEGAQLRAYPLDDLFLTFSTNITPTSDGEGFIGVCPELDLMTCGETEDEVKDLVVYLIVAYLRGEEAQGTLGKTLAQRLKLIEEPTPKQLAIRVYVSCATAQYAQYITIKLGPSSASE